MIIEKQKEAVIIDEGVSNGTIEMSLDLDSAQFLMQMLSKNLYSDSIGSTIREAASNALDSHRRAGIDDPIIVSLKTGDGSNYEFSVEDFGVGLDDEDVANIISKYGKSTKRDTNEEFGMFGLGFKAPLAYTSSFMFVARKNGIERKYIMYEGEEVNSIDLLYESSTTERNGTKIIVSVNYYDRMDFYRKIKEQLAYFKNVYFDVRVGGINIDNDFSIFYNDDFQISQLSSDTNMHICLDDVYYPIDFSKLGISPINIPIGIKFKIGEGLFPTPNRESIRYTQEAKVIIIDKIKKVANFFVDMFNSDDREVESIEDIINFIDDKKKKVTYNNTVYDITSLFELINAVPKSPKLKGVVHHTSEYYFSKSRRSIFTQNYEEKFQMKNGRISESKFVYYSNYPFENFVNRSQRYSVRIMFYTENFSKEKKTYIRERFGSTGNRIYILKKRKIHLFDTSSKQGYYSLLKLKDQPRDKWRELIKEFQYIQSIIEKNLINLDTLEIPQDWIDGRKAARVSKRTFKVNSDGKRVIKLQGEVIGKVGRDLQRYVNGNNCTFDSQTFDLSTFHRLPFLYVYGTHEDSSKLDKLYPIHDKHKLKVISFSEREKKIVDKINIHNLISYERFMKGEHRIFRKIATAILIKKLLEKYNNYFNKSHIVSHFSKSLYNDVIALNGYLSSNYVPLLSKDTIEAMLGVAEEYNLYDESIYSVYLRTKVVFEKLGPVNNLLGTMNHSYAFNPKEDPLFMILKDILKLYKFRMDEVCYEKKTINPPLNEENITDDFNNF